MLVQWRDTMLCRFFRFMISDAADSEKGMGPWTHRHLAGCPDCRQFHRTCRLLAEGLRAEAASLPSASELPAMTFPSRAIRPGRPRHAGAARSSRHVGRPLWAGLGVAACIALSVLAGLIFLEWQAEPPAAPLPPTLTNAVSGMDTVTAWAHALEIPLITEIQNLSRDAQSGILFLVSCLHVLPLDNQTPLPLEQSVPPPMQ